MSRKSILILTLLSLTLSLSFWSCQNEEEAPQPITTAEDSDVAQPPKLKLYQNIVTFSNDFIPMADSLFNTQFHQEFQNRLVGQDIKIESISNLRLSTVAFGTNRLRLQMEGNTPFPVADLTKANGSNPSGTADSYFVEFKRLITVSGGGVGSVWSFALPLNQSSGVRDLMTVNYTNPEKFNISLQMQDRGSNALITSVSLSDKTGTRIIIDVKNRTLSGDKIPQDDQGNMTGQITDQPLDDDGVRSWVLFVFGRASLGGFRYEDVGYAPVDKNNFWNASNPESYLPKVQEDLYGDKASSLGSEDFSSKKYLFGL